MWKGEKGLRTLLCAVAFVLPGVSALGEWNLTEEEARRPAEEWTEEQILAKGWIPYKCFAPGQQALRAAVGKRWPRNDPEAARMGTCVYHSVIAAPVMLDIGVNTAPGAMPGATGVAIAAAMATWEGAADIHFIGGADGGVPWNAPGAGLFQDIRIGSESIDGPLGVLAHAWYPPVTGVSAAGDLHFDHAEQWAVPAVAVGDIDVETVALHELGHSLGLSHAGTVAADVMFPFYGGYQHRP